MLFTKMAATIDFYFHPYFCFQKHANSNNGVTCGFDIVLVVAAPVVVEILYQPYVPEVIIVLDVPTNAVTGAAGIIAVTGVPEILKVVAVPPAVQAGFAARFAVQGKEPGATLQQ